MKLSADQVAQSLDPFGVKLAVTQLEAISTYVDLLVKWNSSVNLTAINDPHEIVSRHFGESIFAASVVPFATGGRLADVGSGAGFPGLPLKVAFPQLDVVLIEPNLKKCAFLVEITRELGMSGVTIMRKRYDEIATADGKWDFLCSRALGDYRDLLRWANQSVSQQGAAVFWVGTDESIRIGRIPQWAWEVPTRIPESKRRVILHGRPSRSS